MPVPALVSVTFAPCTTAPDASRTVPSTVAASNCASAGRTDPRNRRTNRTADLRALHIRHLKGRKDRIKIVTAMNDVLTLFLGGGRGTRLYPLTHMRSKPAAPIGGKYRLIDIPISNCLHAGLKR